MALHAHINGSVDPAEICVRCALSYGSLFKLVFLGFPFPPFLLQSFKSLRHFFECKFFCVVQVRLRVKPPVENMLKEVPITAKQLLATGLLEGHHVRYVGRGGDVRHPFCCFFSFKAALGHQDSENPNETCLVSCYMGCGHK